MSLNKLISFLFRQTLHLSERVVNITLNRIWLGDRAAPYIIQQKHKPLSFEDIENHCCFFVMRVVFPAPPISYKPIIPGCSSWMHLNSAYMRYSPRVLFIIGLPSAGAWGKLWATTSKLRSLFLNSVSQQRAYHLLSSRACSWSGSFLGIYFLLGVLWVSDFAV